MSLETWKAEFYPIKARETHRSDAIDHSLQKWLGLLPENLAKHHVTLVAGEVVDIFVDLDNPSTRGVFIDGDSCSLCHHYMDHDFDEEEGEYESHCHDCPLYQARGGVACDDETSGEWESEQPSPWHSFTRAKNKNDPKPMIHWLTKTKEAACQKSE
jgi:hypothetical protein